MTKHHEANLRELSEIRSNRMLMNFQKVRHYLSPPRFNRYLTATNNDFNRAEALYKAGLQVAASFHPLLGLTEVILRNQLNTVLTSLFNDSNWIVNQKTGFMSHPTLTHVDRRTGRLIVNDFLKASVEAAEKRLRRLGVRPTASKIIAEQNLSFWTDLFEVHHYRLLQGRPIQIFQQLPSGYGRLEVWEALTKVRQFRNRIHHNEPICFNGTAIDFSYPEEIYKAINDLLTWTDTDLPLWVQDVDKIIQTITTAKNI